MINQLTRGADEAASVPWFVPLASADAEVLRVLALPQAGAGCAAFVECAPHLGPGLVLYGLNLPGRQARFNEPPPTDLNSLVSDLADWLGEHSDAPYALVGYCSGALLAFLLARAARDRGLPGPVSLMVISYPAPQRVAPPPELHELPDQEFWRSIVSYGGFPAELAAEPDFREIFGPALRADFALLAGYHHRPAAPLDCPLTVIAGQRDPVLAQDDLLAWREQTTGRFDICPISGGHWLLDSAPAAVGQAIGDACQIRAS